MSLASTAAVLTLALSPMTELQTLCRAEGDMAATLAYVKQNGTTFATALAALEENGIMIEYLHVAILVYTREGTPREHGDYVESSCLETER